MLKHLLEVAPHELVDVLPAHVQGIPAQRKVFDQLLAYAAALQLVDVREIVYVEESALDAGEWGEKGGRIEDR